MKRKTICLFLGLASLGLAQDGQMLTLSLKRAVEIALSPEGNTHIQLAGESVKQAQARSYQVRADLRRGFQAVASAASIRERTQPREPGTPARYGTPARHFADSHRQTDVYAGGCHDARAGQIQSHRIARRSESAAGARRERPPFEQ